MWWTLLPYVAVTLVVVFVPGFVINRLLGFRTLTSLGLAPLVSTGVVASAAILADLVGIGWGPLPIAGWTLLLGAGAFAAARFGRGFARTIPEVRGRRPSLEGTSASALWPLAALGLAALPLGRDSLRILGSPTNFSQTYDNIFHLNGVRWIIENRNGSALNMRMVTGDDPASFYPTAWHDLASASSLSLGTVEPVYSTSAMIIVATAVIWPLSCLLLARRILAPSPTGTLAVGVLAACFTPFPYLLLRFGVLYPNFLGLCLLPAMMALAVSLLDLGDGERWPLLPTWIAAAIGMVALMLAHPNVALTFISMIGSVMITCWALPVVVGALRRRDWTRSATLRLAAFAGWGVAALGLWIVIRPPQEALFWGPVRTATDALVETALISPLDATVVWVPALLTILGAVAVLVTRRGWWLLGAHAVLCFLWLVAANRDFGRARNYIIGPFYNDPYRLAAMLPITALPLAALGVAFCVQRLPKLDERLVAVGTAALLIASTQFIGGKPAMVEWTREAYQINDESPLVDADEYAVLGKVAELVPPDDVIAVSPWNGSSMAYALTGRKTTATHVLYTPDEDKQVLIEHLDDVAIDPEVCPALLDLDVRWVLDFGNERLINNERKPYPGFEHLDGAEGFELVAKQGEAALYRVTACGLG